MKLIKNILLLLFLSICAGVQAGNTLTVEAKDMLVNENLSVSFSISNTVPINGLQFDITYPAVFKPYNNNHTLEVRAKDMTVTARSVGENTWRYFCYFLSESVIAAGKGKVMTLTLKPSGNMVPEGRYTITVKDIKMGSANLKNVYTGSNLSCSFKVSKLLKGDANNNGTVNTQDIDAIVRYIMSGDETGFFFQNADVNGDKKVNAADIVHTTKIIRGK